MNKTLFIINLIIITIILLLQSHNEQRPRSKISIQEAQQIEHIQLLQTQKQSSKNKQLLKHLKSYYQQKECLRSFDSHNTWLNLLDDYQKRIQLKNFDKTELIKNLNQIHYKHPAKLYQLFLLANLATITIDVRCDQICQEKIKSYFSQKQPIDIQQFLAKWLISYPTLQMKEKTKNWIDPQIIDWGMKISLTMLILLIFIKITQDKHQVDPKEVDQGSKQVKDFLDVDDYGLLDYVAILTKFYRLKNLQLDSNVIKDIWIRLGLLVVGWSFVLVVMVGIGFYSYSHVSKFVRGVVISSDYDLQKHKVLNDVVGYFSKEYPAIPLNCKQAKDDQHCADLILPKIQEKVIEKCSELKTRIQEIADISMIDDNEIIDLGKFSCGDHEKSADEVKSSDLLQTNILRIINSQIEKIEDLANYNQEFKLKCPKSDFKECIEKEIKGKIKKGIEGKCDQWKSKIDPSNKEFLIGRVTKKLYARWEKHFAQKTKFCHATETEIPNLKEFLDNSPLMYFTDLKNHANDHFKTDLYSTCTSMVDLINEYFELKISKDTCHGAEDTKKSYVPSKQLQKYIDLLKPEDQDLCKIAIDENRCEAILIEKIDDTVQTMFKKWDHFFHQNGNISDQKKQELKIDLNIQLKIGSKTGLLYEKEWKKMLYRNTKFSQGKKPDLKEGDLKNLSKSSSNPLILFYDLTDVVNDFTINQQQTCLDMLELINIYSKYSIYSKENTDLESKDPLSICN